ncbi:MULTISPECIES: hypothetical protein [Methylomonas]|uniref:Uncharacterized protein n=1 Tax=Methylomonas koyamae TaxID=702114 RepID=A0AA91I4G4_9GAMM|nr:MULTISPECIES: hypothetical protein [Methylomonas]ANE58036.1 hypothetical protein AYM39_22415 [Methylomonas sp. DH-1]OAI24236.1 hypothetical protein A1356_16285 [Methylomonas koyamae]
MADVRPQGIKANASIRKVTVKLPATLKLSLPAKILADGYNMRQKSKWVVEAIQSLLAKNGWEGALLSELVVKPNTQDVFSIPDELVAKINMEAHRVALQNPSLNANQSTIIRAAINRRLIGFFQKPE